VDRNFPLALLPAGEGLIVADRSAGEILREAPNDGGGLSHAQRTIVIDAVEVKV
jgi:hypothetical protein